MCVESTHGRTESAPIPSLVANARSCASSGPAPASTMRIGRATSAAARKRRSGPFSATKRPTNPTVKVSWSDDCDGEAEAGANTSGSIPVWGVTVIGPR